MQRIMSNINARSHGPSKTTLSRTKAAILAMLFLGPLLGAFIWYYGLGARLIPGQINNAPLVDPPVTLSEFQNSEYEGTTVTLSDLRRKWTIIHIIDGRCDQACQTFLYNTRQVRLAVGKDAHRISRMILLESADAVQSIRQEHPDAWLIMVADNGIEEQLLPIIEQFDQSSNRALLIDPLGNVMMAIPDDLSPKLMLKDFKKLLKLSRIG